jgi:hypothetical protein
MQMCKLCAHIVIVQIIIDNVELHSIIIYKHEIGFEIISIDIQGWKMHYNIYILLKYNLIIHLKHYVSIH